MNSISKITLKTILFAFAISFNALAQSYESNSNCQNSDSDILFIANFLQRTDLQESFLKSEIGEFEIQTYPFDVEDPSLIVLLMKYWQEKSVVIVKDSVDCSRIKGLLKNEGVYDTYPAGIKELYFQVKNKFIVLLHHDCGKGCVKLGAEELPAFVIDEHDDIKNILDF